MSDGEVDPKKDSHTELVPPGWEKKVPARAGPAVRALQDLSSKDRRSVLRAFAQRNGGIQTMQQSVMMQASAWSGPLPPPEALARYNDILPNGAERIVAMVERQAAHRIEIESHVSRQQLKQSGRGQIYALIIGISGLGTSAYAAYLGLGAAAGTIATVALGTLAVTFILGKKSEISSRTSKSQPQLMSAPQEAAEPHRPGSQDPPL
jgi:uncharacterized membrane protein